MPVFNVFKLDKQKCCQKWSELTFWMGWIGNKRTFQTLIPTLYEGLKYQTLQYTTYLVYTFVCKIKIIIILLQVLTVFLPLCKIWFLCVDRLDRAFCSLISTRDLVSLVTFIVSFTIPLQFVWRTLCWGWILVKSKSVKFFYFRNAFLPKSRIEFNVFTSKTINLLQRLRCKIPHTRI